jgi:hypothetical protein
MSDGKENVPCYVGRRACGCIVSASVDDATAPWYDAKDQAKWVSAQIKEGLTVERTTVGVVRGTFGCTHEQPKKVRKPRKVKQSP